MDELHRYALSWFEERAGEVVPWPDPLQPTGLLLAQRAKGIHKPAGWHHALSVRVIPTGRYPDELPQQTSTGGWVFRYNQEEPKGGDPALSFTNRSLDRCRLDGVPVGVLRQVSGKPSVRYEVLGLAFVTKWDDGFFTLEGPASVGALAKVTAGDEFDPASLQDSRERTLATITRRRGQPAFRSALLSAYGGRCAVTGSNVEAVLEAAHIVPYLGAHTNVVSNGVLLRADVHTLFDLGLLWFDPNDLTVVVVEDLRGSTYGQLHGRRLRLPRNPDHRPSAAALSTRCK